VRQHSMVFAGLHPVDRHPLKLPGVAFPVHLQSLWPSSGARGTPLAGLRPGVRRYGR
jgi:hypothetical protein